MSNEYNVKVKKEKFSCPYCNMYSVTSDDNTEIYNICLKHFEKTLHYKIINISQTICTNPNCGNATINLKLFEDDRTNRIIDIVNLCFAPNEKLIKELRLLPASVAKHFPDCVPQAIKEDYKEACAIVDLSPKASATLSRRCLQGMIRDCWKVEKDNLFQEINAIKDKVTPKTWETLDAVRTIGNIGAHMEKDVNLIIEIEPNNAKYLIDLIETLIEDWYIAREQRAKRDNKLIEKAQSIKEQLNQQKQQKE